MRREEISNSVLYEGVGWLCCCRSCKGLEVKYEKILASVSQDLVIL